METMGKFTYRALDPVMSGKKIKSIITQSKYSVRELQEMLELECPQPVYRWMKGKTLPSLEKLYMLHVIFGVHMEDMLAARDMGS